MRPAAALASAANHSIWVLLVRRRMLCPSRWVIPDLAEGVTGWPAGQRVPMAQPVFGPRAGARADVTAPGPGCRRDGWPGCCGLSTQEQHKSGFRRHPTEKLEKACRGNTFAQRRDAAILAVFRATGVRLAELAGIRYDPDGPGRSDLDIQRREIKVRGKGGTDRAVRIDHEAARRVDRYLRVRARHEQAYRLGMWLGTGGRGPLTGNGIYQMVKRRGDQAGVRVYPHRFRHHFSHTWLDRGGAEGDLMELNGWSSPQMLERYGGSVRGARARRHYDLVMRD
jgi:integrase